MSMDDHIWHAVNATRILHEPERILETFGQTRLPFAIACAHLDDPGRTVVREGLIMSDKPAIIMPGAYAQELLEDFGVAAADYARWLRAHGDLVSILQYGLQLRKHELRCHEVHEPLEQVLPSLLAQARGALRDGCILTGVDSHWEVSLLHAVAMHIRRSAPVHARDLRAHRHNALIQARHQQMRSIEDEFHGAKNDKSAILRLAQRLQADGQFDYYEDRIYAMLRQCRE